MRDDLTATITNNELVVEVTGEGAGNVPLDTSHLVARSLAAGFERAGRTMPGLTLRCLNVIPHGRGLGSSSAAIVGGLALARDLLPDGAQVLNDEELVELATKLEGHPDNVAPAALGGFTLAWTGEQGLGKAIRLDPHPDLEVVVAIPADRLATERARELLPHTVTHATAAANSARSALLVEAIARRPELLLPATVDQLHQDYRRFAYPQSHALMSGLRSRGIAAMISGAGPTVIALGVRGSATDQAHVEQAVRALVEVQSGPRSAGHASFEVQPLDIAREGVVSS